MRESTTIETPVSKQQVELVSYLTGREKRELVNVFIIPDMAYSTDAKEIKGITPELMNKAQELAIKTIVISVDGKEQSDEFSVVDAVLDMQEEDYEFVVAAVNDIKDAFTKKKTS